MIRRSFEALLLDLDGTLVDDRGDVGPRVTASLRGAAQRGVRVMVVTGRSERATHRVLEELGLEGVAVVYNGAGVYCYRRRRLLEERQLPPPTLAAALAVARRESYLTVLQRAGAKFATAPRDDHEQAAIAHYEGLQLIADGRLPTEGAIRVSLFSPRHPSSDAFCRELEEALDQPCYTTHFPLRTLARHRASPMNVVDVHPPCLGKAEALRVLEEHYGICLLYTSPSPRDRTRSRMPSSA